MGHYKNAMRYKGLAEKFRQATGAADPVPVAALAADVDEEVRRLLGGRQVCKITVRMRKVNGPRDGRIINGTYALDAETLEVARKTAREILDKCEGKDAARTRCGKTLREDGKGKDDAVTGAARPRCGKDRGGVARLEKILDEKLDGMPDGAYAASQWRIGGAASSGARKNGRELASA